MKKIFMLVLAFVGMAASAGVREGYNNVFTSYIGGVKDMEVIRVINGGTVIIPSFDSTCPDNLKSAFTFACKIMEEYLPPCLPIYVNVSCGAVNSSNGTAISKVITATKDNFGIESEFKSVPTTTVKGVLLGEFVKRSTITYYPNIESVASLKQPDMRIVYNRDLLSDISFSLDPDPGEKYDFVSVALRDLFIGLGLRHTYKCDVATRSLIDPGVWMLPFEKLIDEALGCQGNPVARLAMATKGYLEIRKDVAHSVRLFAPNPWLQGLSLNYFIPQSDCSVTSVLSYNFGRGTVARSLNDNYAAWIFEKLLGWSINFNVGGSSSGDGHSGTTGNLIPYKGKVSINSVGQSHTAEWVKNDDAITPSNIGDNEELENYLAQFHPMGPDYEKANIDGLIEIGILKKDGTWDVVETTHKGVASEIDMNSWQFHYDDEEYARSPDGYLRARVCTMEYQHKYPSYATQYYVVDYLPQKVSLSYTSLTLQRPQDENDVTADARLVNFIQLNFGNLEGITRIILEQLREGMKLPAKMEITDFRKGYQNISIDKTTTFTVVGYNANGYKRSLPLRVVVTTPFPQLSCSYKDGTVSFSAEDDRELDLEYVVQGISGTNMLYSISGRTDGSVDISDLPDGMYVVRANDRNSSEAQTFKIRK